MKLIAFDLDNTLAILGKGVTQDTITMLKQLEKQENKIVICSGKPTYYLCGLARQLELQDPILVGENGACIQFGVNLPPKKCYKIPFSDKASQSLEFLNSLFISQFGDEIWYQPNEIALTPFPYDTTKLSLICDIIKINSKNLGDISVYLQGDCLDILPSNIDKGAGLEYVAQQLHFLTSETIAVGDGINDYPMFDFAGLSIGISLKDKTKATLNFDTIKDALTYLLNN